MYNNFIYLIIEIFLFYTLYEFYSSIKLYIKNNILERRSTSNIRKSIKNLSKTGSTREIIVRNNKYIEKVL